MSDTEHDISLRNMREERDREINNEKDSFYQPRDNFHEPNYERENFHDYDYDRDNFQQPNFGNNEYRYQWSNNDNYKGFNSNQEREYAKNGDYFQNNSRNSRQQKRNNYQGNRDSYFDKKYMEQLQKQIEDLHLEIKYLKNKPKRGERFEARTMYRSSENRDTSPAGLSLTHAAQVVDLLDQYLVSNQTDKHKLKETFVQQL